ncbi:MAG: lipopolysaccharide heptosyltransferase II, partial [Desulfuromonadales bacterium]|nr:lipopolysaccharide heptosyltransferase II [Desulfuromonadales bacterium]
PLVAIFGPTDHITTSPYGTRWELVRKPADCAPCLLRQCPTDHRCMVAVTVDDVIAAIRIRRESS